MINIYGPQPASSIATGAGTKLTFRDALGYLPQLLELTWTEDLEVEQKRHLSKLLKVTLQWENTEYQYRSWQRVQDDARFLGLTEDGLREDMLEIIQRFTQIYVRGLTSDPEWAAEGLKILVNDSEKLYHNYIPYRYNATGTTNIYDGQGQEGATFLKGVAAEAFATCGGLGILRCVLASHKVETSALPELCSLVEYLGDAKWQPDFAVLEDLCQVAGEALRALPPAALIDSRKDVQESLHHLFDAIPTRGCPKPACREPIDHVWRALILAGLRSTNLQARRGAAEELASATTYGFSACELAPWLSREGVLKELFGDRIDARVLDELSLKPLCEPSPEGLRVLLAGLEPGLGQEVLHKMLSSFALRTECERDPTVWGRDLVVIEIMRWARGLVSAGREDAVALVVGLCSSTNTKRPLVDFLGDSAAKEADATMVEAMRAPGASVAQVLALEAAFDKAKVHPAVHDFRQGLVARLVAEVQEATCGGGGGGTAAAAAEDSQSSQPRLPTSSVRLLLRALQTFPSGLDHEGSGHNTAGGGRTTAASRMGASTREVIVAGAHPGGLQEILFEELRLFLESEPHGGGDDPVTPLEVERQQQSEASQSQKYLGTREGAEWRLRLLSFVYRCLPDVTISARRLEELASLLRPVAGGRYLCHLLRIASISSPPTGRYQERMHAALDNGALIRSLELLEDWAAECGGLSMPAFYCLQQAVVLVNGHAGRLRIEGPEAGETWDPDFFAAGAVEKANDPVEKGPVEHLIGRWVVVQQDNNGNFKVGRLDKYDDVTEDFAIEYIDGTVHQRKLQRLHKWYLLPPLLHHLPAPVPVAEPPMSGPEGIIGIRGLWSCALGAGEGEGSADVTRRATALLLALHQGPTGARALLARLFEELRSDTTAHPGAAGRCLVLLETLVQQLPLAYRRLHIGRGFPFRLTLNEIMWEEVPYYSWYGQQQSRSSTRRKRQVRTFQLSVHSQMTVEELHRLAAGSIGRRAVELKVCGESQPLQPYGQQTMKEAGVADSVVLEAEAVTLNAMPPEGARLIAGPLDELGTGDGAWQARLLGLLGGEDGSSLLADGDRERCWHVLLQLPTHPALLANVRGPEGWAAILTEGHIWPSAYMVLIIDALASPLSDGGSSGAYPTEKTITEDSWFSAVAAAGGVGALVSFFIAFVEARVSEDGALRSAGAELELSAILPSLVRAVAFCALGLSRGCDAFGTDSGVALVRAAASATRWLFFASKACRRDGNLWWRCMMLGYAAANGIDLIVKAQRRTELPVQTHGLVLPLLVDLALGVEGHVNAQVVFAEFVALAQRPGVAPLLLEHLADAVPRAAAAITSSSASVAPFFDIASQALVALDMQGSALSDEDVATQRRALTGAVARAALATRCNVASLHRLLAVLLKAGTRDCASLPELVGEVGPRLADHLTRCVLPEHSYALDEDATREQAAEALLHLLETADWDLRADVLRKVTGYLANTPTPDSWDFEPAAPPEPSTSADARRNDSGHVGLRNRGMTCYMNSTVQQLFWSLPFRATVLAAAPPVAEALDRPEPLPQVVVAAGSGSGKRRQDRQPKITVADVGWQLQRMFAYLQDCQMGLFNTDEFVRACGCLHLEYNVKSQNDAAEFFDKLCDAADMACGACSGGGGEPKKPSSVFSAKTAREKHCLQCGHRTRGREDELKRVQLPLSATLEECLGVLTASETMAGDNAVDCDACGPKRNTTYRTFFTQLPQILVLHLNRFTFDLDTLERVKMNPRIAFPDRLNMAPYTEDTVVNGSEAVPGCMYELQGVQVHMGGASGGHYYSFAQDVQGRWFKFDDDRVGSFDIHDLDEECFGGVDSKSSDYSGWEKPYNAYMLYYRCIDAAPYRANARPPSSHSSRLTTPMTMRGDGDEPILPPSVHRSISERGTAEVQRLGAPPPLTRNITQAFCGERLVDRQRRRRQAQLRATLLEEVESTNTRLHRQAVVFSAPSERFALSLVKMLRTSAGLCGATTQPAGAPLAAAKALIGQEQRVQFVESLCRLTAKVLFDVAFHSAGSKRDDCIDPWVELLATHLRSGMPEAPKWLLLRLAGEPDAALGREPCAWLPTAIFQCTRGGRFGKVANLIGVAANAAAVSKDAEAKTSCVKLIEALLTLMSSVASPIAMSRYGELWDRLSEPPASRALLAEHRGEHGFPAFSLLLHLYLGGDATPLPSPPAPRLLEEEKNVRHSRCGYQLRALLRAAGKLLDARAELAEEPIVRSVALWRAIARRNPEVLAEEDLLLRRALSEDHDVQVVVLRALIEGLRPAGVERSDDPTLRTALRFALALGGEEQLALKLALLCEISANLAAAARRSTSVVHNYSSHCLGSQRSATSGGRSHLAWADLAGQEVADQEKATSRQRRWAQALTIDITHGPGAGYCDGDICDGPPTPRSDRGEAGSEFGDNDIVPYDLFADSEESKTRHMDNTYQDHMPAVPSRSAAAGSRESAYCVGPRNPEAVQLLRILQVVADLVPQLPEGWAWAHEWLGEVCDWRNAHRWEGQGLPLSEARFLRAKLQPLVALDADATDAAAHDLDSRENVGVREVIHVRSAGTDAVNGSYTFTHDDWEGCPHYEHQDNSAYMLRRECLPRHGDLRWVLERESSDGGYETLYLTSYVYASQVETPYPPLASSEWEVAGGEFPCPTLEVSSL